VSRPWRAPFVVWGAAYASPNVGDMAIAQAIIRSLRRGEPKAEIVFVTSGRYDAHISGDEDVSIVNASRHPIRVLRLLRKSRLLLIAGGVPFGDSTVALLRFLVLATAARLVGAEVAVVASSAAGDKLHPLNEIICRAILSLIKSVAVRDQKSLQLLRRLKGRDSVDFVPDLVLAMDLASEPEASRFRPPGLADHEPYIVIAPRNFLAAQPYLRTHFAGSFDEAGATRLLASLAEVTGMLGRDHRVVFLPMNVDEGDDVVGLRVAEAMAAPDRPPVVIEDRLSVDQTCALIKGADLVLGMRLHAVIFGIALERPTIALAYAGKVSGFMAWLALEEDALPLTASSEELLEACRRRLAQGMPPHVAPVLERARRQIRDRFARLSQRPGPSVLAPHGPAIRLPARPKGRAR
jgi:polysaccharide pyruvyl transferase WcaK-like protein